MLKQHSSCANVCLIGQGGTQQVKGFGQQPGAGIHC